MQEPSFDKLAQDAAAGVQADREVYLEVTQELTSFLEDKTEQFHREGHSDEESIELAKKAFGSPLDMAAELRTANMKRLRLRALFRIAFGAVIVPLAVLLALVVGYGRFARLQNMQEVTRNFSGTNGAPPSLHFPTWPYFGFQQELQTDMRLLQNYPNRAEGCYFYWEGHRQEPDSHIYYAYYTIYALAGNLNDRDMVALLRRGEQIEPVNALYNLQLAGQYLSRGMVAATEQTPKDRPQVDELYDRQAFELGIAELRKAAAKPYLRTYQTEVMRRKFDTLPPAVLTEDYIQRISLASAEIFPQFGRMRSIARKIPGCARLLIHEDRKTEAESLMDTWRPLMHMLTQEEDNSLIQILVARVCGEILTAEGACVYTQLGKRQKAQDIQAVQQRLAELKKSMPHSGWDELLQRHGTGILKVFGGFTGPPPTATELAPARIAEHIVYAEQFVQVLQMLLVLLLAGTLLQGALWLHRLRGAASVPLLLQPPAREVAHALWWGLALPLLVYGIYACLPVIGGRENGFGYLRWRFLFEFIVFGAVILWLPAHLMRRVIRRRCEELNLPLPDADEEATTSRKVRGALVAALFILVMVIMSFLRGSESSPYAQTSGVCLACMVAVCGWRYAGAKRNAYGLYYGMLARSLAPVYAFAILLLALLVQPLLVSSEVYWLRKDTLVYSYLADRQTPLAGFTSLEAYSARAFAMKLRKALGERE